MTKDVVVVQMDEGLRQVVDKINHFKIRHVPVLSGNKLVGIVSRTDINRLSFSAIFPGVETADDSILDMLTIEQVMVRHPRVVTRGTDIREVAEILSTEEYHALPVVDDSDENMLSGIVTTTDVIRYLLAQY
ncbi:MAG: CBS domain-containing protein [Bacteroidia bacterium]|nr:CBS domain-containing protein [Bacteroidia bacterium]